MARLGRPLFTESMEAWTYGPVVPTVYAEYAQYGRTLIKAPAEDANQLTEDERSFVAAIWSDYKRFSAQKLVSMTHGEPPWKKARKGLAHDAPSRNIVHRSDMTAHFLRPRTARRSARRHAGCGCSRPLLLCRRALGEEIA